MLLIDDRVGSQDLLGPLKQYGVECELQHLAFGDVAFIGRGLNGADLFIGIELKETRDLISSLHSARFPGHQLPGLQAMYDRVWLVTEGIWRAGDEGVLEVMAGGWRPVSIGKHRITASDLDSWILTQVIRGGIQHHHCGTRKDTIRFISTLYRWWTSKDMDEHRSHQAIYLPPPDRMMLVAPSTFLKVASCLPGVGWEKAAKLEEYCRGSLVRLVELTAEELQTVPGIGKGIAQKIISALRGAA
jgi:ERCC4-type nuclease